MYSGDIAEQRDIWAVKGMGVVMYCEVLVVKMFNYVMTMKGMGVMLSSRNIAVQRVYVLLHGCEGGC